MPKDAVDQEGNIFTATKELVMRVDDGNEKATARFPCKDIETVQEAITSLKEKFEEEGLKFNEDFFFEVNDL